MNRYGTTLYYTTSCEVSCTGISIYNTTVTCCDSNNCNHAAPEPPFVTSCFVINSSKTYPSNTTTCSTNSNFNYCKVKLKNIQFIIFFIILKKLF